MIVTRRIALRIAALIVIAVVLQISFFSYLSFFGTTPNIIPLVVIVLGLLGGAVLGAVCGFATGLLLDSALLQTLGASSLVLLGVGYLAGRYREASTISNSLVPPLLIGALTTAAAAGFAAIQLMLGVRSPVSLLVLREIVVQGLLAVVLAIPFYPLIRRVLRSAIVDDFTARRGRTPLTRGASRPRRTRGRRMRRAAGARL
jgi:rod shape-determining protein MreD